MTVRELITKLGFNVDTSQLKKSERVLERNRKKVGALDRRWQQFQRRTIKSVGKGLTKLSHGFTAFSNRLETNFAGVLKPLREVGRQIPIIGGAISGMSAGVIALAGGIAAVAIAVRKLRAATEIFMNFEREMKGVARVTLASAEEMKRLEQAALDAASASIFTTAQAAQAQKFLAMAGLSTEEVIEALPDTLQLAAAAEMDLARAADIATNVLTSNQLRVEELGRVNDVLAKTANSANTDVLQLGEAFVALGSTGALAGVDVAELSSLFGILANSGIRGGLAGTLLRNALQDLSAPSARIKKDMAALGISMDTLTDSMGRFQEGKLLEFFGKLNQAISEGAIKGTELSNVFGERSGRAIAAFAATNGRELVEMFDKIKNSAGTAAKASRIAFEGLTGAIKKYQSRREAATVRAVQRSRFNELLRETVELLSDVIPPLIEALGFLLRPVVFSLRPLIAGLRFIASILGGIISVLTEIGSVIYNQFFGPLEGVFNLVDKIISIINTLFRITVLGIRNITKNAGVLIQRFIGNIRRFIEPILRRLEPVFRFISGLIDRISRFLGETEARLEYRLEPRVAPAMQLMEGGIKGGIGQVNFDIQTDVSVNGVAGSPEEVGEAVASKVGKAVKAQFGIELRKILISAGY